MERLLPSLAHVHILCYHTDTHVDTKTYTNMQALHMCTHTVNLHYTHYPLSTTHACVYLHVNKMQAVFSLFSYLNWMAIHYPRVLYMVEGLMLDYLYLVDGDVDTTPGISTYYLVVSTPQFNIRFPLIQLARLDRTIGSFRRKSGHFNVEWLPSFKKKILKQDTKWLNMETFQSIKITIF